MQLYIFATHAYKICYSCYYILRTMRDYVSVLRFEIFSGKYLSDLLLPQQKSLPLGQ